MSSAERRATVERRTNETEVSVTLDLDPGRESNSAAVDRSIDCDKSDGTQIDVPGGFFAHMLDALTKHSGVQAQVRASGDTHIDLHHTVEDVGLVFGEALAKALGERQGIVRFAHAYAPLDEALSRAVIDLSGRGSLHLRLPEQMEQAWVTQDFPLTLIEDFLQAFADRGRLTLHVDVLFGRNPHHVAEAVFKSVALALRQAVAQRSGDQTVPSTKGTLNE